MNTRSILYKYRYWNNNSYSQDLFLKNEFYLSPPSLFNDPFDCRNCINYDLLSSEEILKYADNVSKNSFANVTNEQREIIRNKVINTLIKADSKIKKQEESEQLLYESQNNYYGIICLTKKWDNILMWGHYANSHQGICIGFYQDELIKLNGMQGKIEYVNEYPSIHPLATQEEKAIKEIFYKSKDWEYEKEYRILKTFHIDEGVVGIRDPRRKVIVDDSCFAEVILGLNFNENINQIIGEAQRKNIPVYQTKRVRNKFELDRQKIS